MLKYIVLIVLTFPLMAWSQSLDLSDLHTPAKDQGASDTCAFYAVTAALEHALIVQFNQSLDLSEKFEWHRSKILKQQRPEVEFGDTYLLAENLAKDGYSQTEDGGKVTFSGLRFTELTQLWVKTPWSEQVIAQLDKKRSVVLTLKLSNKSVNDRTGDLTFSEQDEAYCLQTPAACGGHAVVITGYNKQSRLFTFKNSWGPKWGNLGFGQVTFDHVDRNSFDHIVLYFDRMFSPKLSLP